MHGAIADDSMESLPRFIGHAGDRIASGTAIDDSMGRFLLLQNLHSSHSCELCRR